MVRPKYLSLTVALMCITDAMGWLTVEWNKPHARTRMVVFTLLILIGYVFCGFTGKVRTGPELPCY